MKPKLFDKLTAPAVKLVEEAAERYNSDRYIKKYFTRDHAKTMLYHQLSDVEHLRGIDDHLKANEEIKETVNNSEVNLSQLSRANKDRDYRIFEYIFKKLFKKTLGIKDESLKKLEKIKIVDSSLIKACASMICATYKKGAKAIKTHLLLDFRGLPEKVVVTKGRVSDKKRLKQFIKRKFTYIFDRGYNDYKLFSYIIQRKAFFITRLLKNAKYELIKKLNVYPLETGILFDGLIRLGCPQKEMAELLRLIIYLAPDGKIYKFITNRLDLSAKEVCNLFRFRWEIELFFRWVKGYLKVKKFIGRSKNAVLIQIYSALIAFLLLYLYFAKVHKVFSLTVSLLRRIKCRLFEQVTQEEVDLYLNSLNLPSEL